MPKPEWFKPGDVISHGAYGEFAGTKLVRLKYAAYDPEYELGYLEVLAFPEARADLPKAVCVVYLDRLGFTVFSFNSAESAMGFSVTPQIAEVIEGKRPDPGYLKGRIQRLGEIRPWFYRPPPRQPVTKCAKWQLDLDICQGNIRGECPEKIGPNKSGRCPME